MRETPFYDDLKLTWSAVIKSAEIRSQIELSLSTLKVLKTISKPSPVIKQLIADLDSIKAKAKK